MSFKRLRNVIMTLSFVVAAGILTAGAAATGQRTGDAVAYCTPGHCVVDKDKDPDIDPWHDTGPKGNGH
jgi:hypothetical protein